MALQTEKQELFSAWIALAGESDAEGWRTIPVVPNHPVSLLAGRRFPGNEEALLVGFGAIKIPMQTELPQGRGFTVSAPDLGAAGMGKVWIALSRQQAGRLEFFGMMAEDVVMTLGKLHGSSPEIQFRAFLSRIVAWQDFMRHAIDGVLAPDAELGLFGELELLHDLLTCGMQEITSVEAWQGPLNGIHDFTLGHGAIEVKSTISSTGFSAHIGSLQQLDDTVANPLFLVAERFAVNTSGLTLTDQVRKIRSRLDEVAVALSVFDSRLLHAGYLDAKADNYTCRFVRARQWILRVSEGFPRLISKDLPAEIRKANYELEIGSVCATEMNFIDAIRELGMVK